MHSWYTLYTKPNAEQQVNDALQSRGIETYLPTIPVWRARRRRLEDEPLFHCYTFAHLDLQTTGVSTVAWLSGLRYIVATDGVPVALPESVLDYLRARAAELALQGESRFQPGDRLRIISGPFKDLDAVFDRHLSGHERAQVLVQLLGSLTRCEIAPSSLEAA